MNDKYQRGVMLWVRCSYEPDRRRHKRAMRLMREGRRGNWRGIGKALAAASAQMVKMSETLTIGLREASYAVRDNLRQVATAGERLSAGDLVTIVDGKAMRAAGQRPPYIDLLEAAGFKPVPGLGPQIHDENCATRRGFACDCPRAVFDRANS